MKPAFVETWEELGSPEPMPDELKHAAILHYAKKNKARWLVETGTYMGGTALALQDHIEQIKTIEASTAVYDQFRDLHPVLPDNVEAILGKSYEVLPTLVPTLPGPRVFWLDAHGSTWGHEFKGGTIEVPESSVLRELAIVFAQRQKGDVVLVDDTNIFGTYGWMPLEEVIEFVENGGFSCRVEGLILVCELP